MEKEIIDLTRLTKLKDEIHQEFQQLNELAIKNASLTLPHSFGPRVFNKNRHPINPNPWQVIWNEAIGGSVVANLKFDKRKLLHRLLSEMKIKLKSLGYDYSLFSAPNIVVHQLSTIILGCLPQSQKIITDFFVSQDQSSLEQMLFAATVLQNILVTINKNVSEMTSFKDNRELNSQEYKHFTKSLDAYNEIVENFFSSFEMKFLNLAIAPNDITTREHIFALNAIDAGKQMQDSASILIGRMLEQQRKTFLFFKYLGFGIALLISIVVLFFVIYKVITRHLEKIISQITDLKKGIFFPFQQSSFKDEFGLTSQAFTQLASALYEVLGKMRDLECYWQTLLNSLKRPLRSKKSSSFKKQKRLKKLKPRQKKISSDSTLLGNP